MKRFLGITFTLALLLYLSSCGSSRKAAETERRKQEKLEQLEKDKQDFEQKNRNDLK